MADRYRCIKQCGGGPFNIDIKLVYLPNIGVEIEAEKYYVHNKNYFQASDWFQLTDEGYNWWHYRGEFELIK